MLHGFHAAAVACSRVQRNSVPSTHMRCMITANRRARATIAFFIPRRLAKKKQHVLRVFASPGGGGRKKKQHVLRKFGTQYRFSEGANSEAAAAADVLRSTTKSNLQAAMHHRPCGMQDFAISLR